MTPTAEEFLKGRITETFSRNPFYQNILIEFAKLHVKEALKQASEKVTDDISIDWVRDDDYSAGFNGLKGEINKDSIIEAYSLENIK